MQYFLKPKQSRNLPKSLEEIQTRNVIKQTVKDANDSNFGLNLVILRRLFSELAANRRLGFPFFTGNRLEDKQKIDLSLHNRALRYLNNDIDTIIQATGLVKSKIEKLGRTIERGIKMILSGAQSIDREFRALRTEVGLAKFTHREDFSDTSGIDLSVTTAQVNTDQKLATAPKSNLFDGNVKIGPLSPDVIQALTDELGAIAVDVNLYNIFVAGNAQTSTTQVVKERRQSTEVTIVANLADIRNFISNTVVIRTAHKVPTRTTIIVDSEGTLVTVAKDVVLLNSTYTFKFPPTKITKVLISMRQEIESAITEDNRYFYQYKIDFVSMELVNHNTTTELISTEITCPFPITDVAMESTEVLPEGTSSEYYVSTDQNDWIPITPQNISKAPNNIVNITTKSANQVEIVDEVGNPGKSKPWNQLTPLEEFGNIQLYNILENANSPKILSGMIVIEDDEEIIPESIKVYRGMDDYSIEKLKIETKSDVQDVLYRAIAPVFSGIVSPLNIVDDQIKINPYIRIDAETHVVDTNGMVTTVYPIANNNIIVIDTATNLRKDILSFSGNEITLLNTPTNTRVVVTYHSLVSDMEETDGVLIEIDPESVQYKFNDLDDEFIDANDIAYSSSARKFIVPHDHHIPPTGNLGWGTIYLTFSFTRKARKEFDVYRTFVYYEQKTKIQILPFSEEELFAGNFHIIDGRYVSRNIELEVEGGLHEIITTQPFNTDPDNSRDVNRLTGKPTVAGIILQDYLFRRAYQKSLRMVSAFSLSNVIAPSNRDAFAFDGNRILLNYVPEYLPENTPTFATHLTGKTLFLKTAEYLADGKNTFDEYVEKEEQFLIEFDTRPKAGTANDKRSLYVRVILTPNTKTGTAPTLFNYEVLFF